MVKGLLGDAFREFRPAIFSPAAAFPFVRGIKNFMKFATQTGFENHLTPPAGVRHENIRK